MNTNYFSNKAVVVEGISTQDFKDIVRSIVQNVIQPLKEDIASLKGTTTYTIKEAAKKIGKHDSTVYRYCKSGKIKASKSGQSYIITHTSLQQFIEPQNI